MSDILSPETFADTGANAAVNGARMNNHVNGATILPAFISGKGSGTPVGGDSIVFYSTSGASLLKCTLSTVLGLSAIPTDPVAGTAGIRTLGTGAQQAAPGNDTRFPASVTGIRKGAGAGSTDVAATAGDLAFAPLFVDSSSGTSTLDCATHDTFITILNVDTTISVINIPDGATIMVEVVQDSSGAHTIAFSTTQTKVYPNSTAPTPSTAINSIDIWLFKRIADKIFCTLIPSFG